MRTMTMPLPASGSSVCPTRPRPPENARTGDRIGAADAARAIRKAACEPAPPGTGDALLLVDLQRDHLPGGGVPVPGSDRVVHHANRYLDLFAESELPVYFSRDWHPQDHCSFREQGGAWPRHCVAGSVAAAFAEALRLPSHMRVVSKSTRSEHDSQSAFDGTDLAARLRATGVRRLFVGGVATDHGVLQTVKDARALGLEVLVLYDAVAAVSVRSGDGVRALAEMRRVGASITGGEEIIGRFALA